ncbi:943_t:CDS:1, partial [Paraglomus brasilianum]
MVDVTDYIMDTEIVIRDKGAEDGNPENRVPTNKKKGDDILVAELDKKSKV